MAGNNDMQEPDLVFPTLEEALHTPLSARCPDNCDEGDGEGDCSAELQLKGDEINAGTAVYMVHKMIEVYKQLTAPPELLQLMQFDQNLREEIEDLEKQLAIQRLEQEQEEDTENNAADSERDTTTTSEASSAKALQLCTGM